MRATTLAAATKLKEAGAEVEEVSVPLHRDSKRMCCGLAWVWMRWSVVGSTPDMTWS